MRSILLSACVLICGCAEASDKDGELDRGAKFAAVDEEQGLLLCDELNRIAHGDALYVERVCTTIGVMDAAFEGGTCAQHRAACIDDPEPVCVSDEPDGNEDFTGEDDCPNATVGMFLDCMRGSLRVTKELYASVTCETSSDDVFKLARDNLALLAERTPVECAAFKQACPVFFERPALAP